MAKIREQEEGLLCQWPVLPDSIEGKRYVGVPYGLHGGNFPKGSLLEDKTDTEERD